MPRIPNNHVPGGKCAGFGLYLGEKCPKFVPHYARIFTEKERRPVQWAPLFILKARKEGRHRIGHPIFLRIVFRNGFEKTEKKLYVEEQLIRT